MLDVLVVCEGQTEREFCREVVGPSLLSRGVALAGTLVGKPQRKQGGVRPWQRYRVELLRLASERADRHVGVLVDYYGMPHDWPGRSNAPAEPIDGRGEFVESALRADLYKELPGRFHPCVQLHEFESLIFVDPHVAMLSIAIGGGNADAGDAASKLANIRRQFDGKVERINDDPSNAPSKRIKAVLPAYDKVAWGVLAAKDVGVPTLRAGAPWLDRWLTSIERAATSI